MKKTILAAAMLFASVVSAQDFYVALSGGASGVGVTNELSSSSKAIGSYGEGYQGQVRLGYMITEKFGLDLGVGYLHGDDQELSNANGLKMNARARAFGASLSGVYNFSDHVYMRAGVLTKLAGKTEVEASLETMLPTPVGVFPLAVEVERENTGSFPVGFVGAFGVKFDLGKNFGFFVEMDYLGINVPANKSVLKNASIKLAGKDYELAKLQGQLAAAAPALPVDHPIVSLGQLIADELTYVENPDVKGLKEAPAFDAPYSSFGFNVGFTYSFDFK